MKDRLVVLIYILAGLIALLLGLSVLCSEPRAEWVHLKDFRGIVTNATANNVPMERARKSVSWHFGGNGELRRTTLDWKNTNPYASRSGAIEWFAPTRYDNEFFLYNGFLRLYNISLDSTRTVTTSYVDDVRTYAANTVVRRNAAASSKWLELSLTDIEYIVVRSAIGDSIYPTYGGPVNDTTWRVKNPTRAQYNSDPDTLSLSSISISSTDGPPGIFIANDTTWISDGNYLIKQLGDSVSSIAYPTFADTTTVTAYIRPYGSDSAFCLVGSFPDSQLTGDHYRLVFWYQPMVDVTPMGKPINLFRAVNNGATDTLYFAADSAQWGGAGTGPTNIRVRAASACYAHRSFHPSDPAIQTYLWQDTGSWDYRGTFMQAKYGVFTPNQPTQHLSSIYQYDGRMIQAFESGAHRYYARVISEDGDGATGGTVDTLKVLVWGYTGAANVGTDRDNGFKIVDDAGHWMRVTEYPRQTVAANAQSWNWRLSCLHRFRAFYAGNPDTLSQLAWSADNNYDSIAGTELLEGDDPVTALSSMTDLYIYRRYSIRGLQGSDPADFYLVPSPSGVGAVNNATVIRDPYSNTDYFCNQLGMWQNASGSVSEIPTACPEIFTDSINWQYEKNFTASIHDRKYWLSCIFGVPSNKIAGREPENNRVVVIDLDGSDVTFQSGVNVRSMYLYRAPGSVDRLFWGDADSTRLVEIGRFRDLIDTGDWRSSWTDFGLPGELKRIDRGMVSISSAKYDTLFLDYYTRTYSSGLIVSENAVITDTIAGVTAGGAISTVYFSGNRSLIGNEWSIGVRSDDSAIVVIDVALDVLPVLGQRRMK